MQKVTRWKGRRGWAVGVAIAAVFVVGVLVSPGVWSAVSAQASGAINSSAKVAKCRVGGGPADPAYDPVNHEIYVPNHTSNNISVVKAPCTVAATIKLPSGSEPTAAAFDPANNYVYVTDPYFDTVYVLDGTKLVTTLHGFVEPEAIAYDPCRAGMIVANFGGDNLTSIAGTSVYGSYAVGLGPDGIDYYVLNYDPSQELVVTNYYSGNATLLDACDLLNEGSVGVGTNPYGGAYAPVYGFDFVPNFGSGNVTTLSVGKFGVTSGFPLINGFNEPSSATWSQARLAVYVTNYGSGKLTVIGPAGTILQNISVAKGIWGSAYDDATDDLYVTDVTTGILYVYST
jgi:DNA-binding beta-propeller fold protein YncE